MTPPRVTGLGKRLSHLKEKVRPPHPDRNYLGMNCFSHYMVCSGEMVDERNDVINRTPGDDFEKDVGFTDGLRELGGRKI